MKKCSMCGASFDPDAAAIKWEVMAYHIGLRMAYFDYCPRFDLCGNCVTKKFKNDKKIVVFKKK